MPRPAPALALTARPLGAAAPTPAEACPSLRLPPGAPAPPILSAPDRSSGLGRLAAVWGVAGQVALVATPSLLLLRTAVEQLTAAALGPRHLVLAAGSLALLGHFQGYRGFQRRYAPFVAARAAHLARHPAPLHALAAPLFVCGLVGATPRRRASTALIFAVMPLLAAGTARLPAPYRGLLDLGVAFGLAWGAASLTVLALRAARGSPPAVPLDLPAPWSAP